MDALSETAINIQNIKTWGNIAPPIAMTFWNQNENKQYQSIITSDGAFIGKNLIITAENDVSRRIPYVSSKSEGNTIGNGLGIGAVPEIINGENKGVISLFSRRYNSQGMGDIDLVLNPYHFHFGDTLTFEINRKGQAVFSKIELKDVNLSSQILLDGSSIQIDHASEQNSYLHLYLDDITPRATFHQVARYGTSFLECKPGTIQMKDYSISNYPELLLTPQKIQLNNAKAELTGESLKIGTFINLLPSTQIIGEFVFTNSGKVQCDKHVFELSSNQHIDLKTNGHVGLECSSILINNNKVGANGSIQYRGGYSKLYNLEITHGFITNIDTIGDGEDGVTATIDCCDPANNNIPFLKIDIANGIIVGITHYNSDGSSTRHGTTNFFS